MKTTKSIAQSAKNSNAVHKTNDSEVRLLPERSGVHIDTFDADKSIMVACPCKTEDSSDGCSFIFPNGDKLAEGSKLKATIDYPLSSPVEFEVTLSYFINDMLGEICAKYHQIYKEEEETSKKKAMPLCEEIPGCPIMNRNFTDGIHGIWGHDISDLYIERLSLDTKSKTLSFSIGC